MSRKVFTAGEVLAAADVNSFLMDQTVMSFAGTAARGSAIPTPVEGMAAYLEDSNILSLYDGANWKTSLGAIGGVVQVVSTTKSDPFTLASASFTAVTGLEVSITPKSASNKILVISHMVATGDAGSDNGAARLMRQSTPIAVGAAAGSRMLASYGLDAGGFGQSNTVTTLDSPNTTSEVTYKIEIRRNSAATAVMHVNRNKNDSDSSTEQRYASSLTVMEISA
jgi:hypothetical protein